MLRIGMIGTGLIAHEYAKAIVMTPDMGPAISLVNRLDNCGHLLHPTVHARS